MKQAYSDKRSSPGASILIVDDERLVLAGMERIFRHQHYAVHTSTDGATGLEILASTPVDVVLSDLRMPGMDGATFLKHCHERHPQIPRIVLSGDKDLDSVIEVVNSADIYNFIQKPADPEELKITVKNAVEQRVLKTRLEQAERARTSELEQAVARRTSDLNAANRLLQQVADEEKAIAHLLELAINEKDLRQYLVKSIRLLIESVPWLSALPKGLILLSERNSGSSFLHLAAEYNIASEQVAHCSKIALGYCLCGQAAEQRQILFADFNDIRHDIKLTSGEQQCHYNIPILHNDEVLGVLALYMRQGHQQSERETLFLQRAANILSLGIREHYIIDDLKLARADAETDAMTGLYNRRFMDQYLNNEWNRHVRNRQSISLLMIDIDYFKHFNDTYGHAVGDECLISVAEILKTCAQRFSDIACRYGGEEFVIILADSDADAAAKVATSVMEAVKQKSIPHKASAVSGTVTLSIGICSTVPTGYNKMQQLLERSDAALYQAKQSGRNRFCRADF